MDMRFGRRQLADTTRIAGYNALQLAYIGDTVYDLFVRTHLLEQCDQKAGALHRQAIGLVCAAAQAEALKHLEPHLEDRERDVVRRGRNAHAQHAPRNVDRKVYAQATALEALIGYLYLIGEDERLTHLMRMAIVSSTGNGEETHEE